MTKVLPVSFESVPAQQPVTSGDAYVNDLDDETGEVTTDWVVCADPDCAV